MGTIGDRRERANNQPPRRIERQERPDPGDPAALPPTTRSRHRRGHGVTPALPRTVPPSGSDRLATGPGRKSAARSTDSGTVSRTRAHRWRRVGHSLGNDGLRGGPGVGRLARQHLVQHAAQRVDDRSGRRCSPLAHRLLRAHVGRRADGEAGLRQACRSRRRRSPGRCRSRPPARGRSRAGCSRA